VQLARATPGAWLVTPGIAEWSKRRRHFLPQGVGAPSGDSGAAWGKGPPGRKRGAILAIVPGAQRRNAPRSSLSASPFAGGRETGGLSWLTASRSRVASGSGASMKCGRGNRPHHARAGTTEGCAAGSRRGLACRKSREPSLGSAGPRAPFTFGWVPTAWLDARVSPQGAARANVGMKQVASCNGRGCDVPQQWPVHRRIAEVVRPFSGSEKRALGSERVESPNEARGGWTGT